MVETKGKVIYTGLFLTGEKPLADVKKAAALSGNVPEDIYVHPLRRKKERIANEIDPLTGRVIIIDLETETTMKVIKGTPRGTTPVEIMMRSDEGEEFDERKVLTDFWENLDNIMRHPSRLNEPIRKRPLSNRRLRTHSRCKD